MPVEMLEEPEVLQATKSPHGYLASPISDNISQREDGSLIIVGCPVARCGWQEYSVKNLPQEKARQLGVDISNPDATINLYRAPEDVFDPKFLSSLNGAPITDNHPPEGIFVDSKNFKEYVAGHIQNPRKGPEPLDDGNWPVIADLIISGQTLVSKVLNKSAREISLGYDFSIDRDGDKICQTGMLGNHCAIVPQGRAGDFVSIQDAAPAEADQGVAVYLASLDAKTEAVAPAEVIDPVARAESSEIQEAQVEAPKPAYIPIQFNPSKEKTTVKANKLLRLFMGKHLIEMARATDASPEAIMDAVESLPPEEAEEPVVDKKAKDDVEVPGNTQENEFQSEDRKRMHDALDAMLDEDDETGEMEAAGRPGASDRKRSKDRKRRAKDADIAELKTLLDQFLGEEAEEPEHAAADIDTTEDPDAADLEAALSDEEPPCAECGGEGCEACDDELGPDDEDVQSDVADADDPTLTEPEDEDHMPAADRRRAKDAVRKSRAVDGAKETLRMLRPFVAKANDAGLNRAFNTALSTVNKKSRTQAQDGGYAGFARASRTRESAPSRARAADSGDTSVTASNQKLQAAYDAARGGK